MLEDIQKLIHLLMKHYLNDKFPLYIVELPYVVLVLGHPHNVRSFYQYMVLITPFFLGSLTLFSFA